MVPACRASMFAAGATGAAFVVLMIEANGAGVFKIITAV